MTDAPAQTDGVADDDVIDEGPAALPLDAWHEAKGARMVAFAGYRMPIQYEGIMPEHQWVRAHAGLFDVSHMGQLLLSADDGFEGLDDAIEALVPADVKSLALGKMRYSLLLAENGGILDDLMLSRWPGGIYMVVNGATKYDDLAHLREHLPDEITINHLDDRALLALQGPEAFAALSRHVTGEWPLDVLGFMSGGRFEIAGGRRVHHPLGLYRRGRVRDLDPGRGRRGGRRRAVRRARGQADRSGCARLAQARGRPAALRPRSRRGDDACRRRSRLRALQAPARGGRLPRL